MRVNIEQAGMNTGAVTGVIYPSLMEQDWDRMPTERKSYTGRRTWRVVHQSMTALLTVANAVGLALLIILSLVTLGVADVATQTGADPAVGLCVALCAFFLGTLIMQVAYIFSNTIQSILPGARVQAGMILGIIHVVLSVLLLGWVGYEYLQFQSAANAAANTPGTPGPPDLDTLMELVVIIFGILLFLLVCLNACVALIQLVLSGIDVVMGLVILGDQRKPEKEHDFKPEMMATSPSPYHVTEEIKESGIQNDTKVVASWTQGCEVVAWRRAPEDDDEGLIASSAASSAPLSIRDYKDKLRSIQDHQE